MIEIQKMSKIAVHILLHGKNECELLTEIQN